MRAIDADRLLWVLDKNYGHTGGAAVMRQLIDIQPTLAPPNEPLTLEQLREMHGKPVWVKKINHSLENSWGIVCLPYGQQYVLQFIALTDGYVQLKAHFSEYGHTWLAYPYPPARIDREKWELCEWCGSVGKTPDNWVCTLEDENGHTVTNQHMVVCAPVNYCPVCGRPLTPEAWEEMKRRVNG